VDGARALSQRFEEPDERLTEDEVQAIIKRYGERQPGGDARSTVADVAEALQVEPSVVSKLLREVRTADSERELRERLDRLERENESLRRRAEESEYDDFYPAMHWSRRRMRARRPAMLMAAAMAAMLAVGISASARGGSTPMPVFGILIVGFAAFVAIRLLRGRRML
jgi:hypothetical protein